ncbi:ATPase H(+)-transporting accessory protein 2-like [Drosophila busckii]|uniref:ATPase H(+)-transporting accessory protein 2-like n=1 Tax=Drosophila busckii TaxID=30019 RepID=UPI00083F4BB5|nr:ATPase H(+)-transporting accessory protein 2-like [Drosophila busckii]
MWQQFCILSLVLATVRAAGELKVLSCPKSLKFEGHDALQSWNVGDLLVAAQGNAVTSDSEWMGLAIVDPFSLANMAVVVVHVKGIQSLRGVNKSASFELIGADSGDALDALVSELLWANETINEFNFDKRQGAIAAMQRHYKQKKLQLPKSKKPLKHLTPSQYQSHRLFLADLQHINLLSSNLSTLIQPSQMLIVRISLEQLVKSSQNELINVQEAKELLLAAINRLLIAARNSSDSLLFVLITDKQLKSNEFAKRKRKPDENNPFDMDEKANGDTPVIFNIILWFMVAFVLSLGFICYTVATIDPGRNSIIYRISNVNIDVKKNA